MARAATPSSAAPRKRPRKARNSHHLRHISSINDLQNAELDAVFALADEYLKKLSDAGRPNIVSRSTTVASGKILASIFLEPSTRTRLSFESAMHRLGGFVITSADPAMSSAAKGESLCDTVRVTSAYADVIVLRHPRDGAARLAAEYAEVPVINAGDGAHEHPTQTLCDLFTLKREHKALRGLNVAISGDLKGSRTIHSFVYALARLRANLLLMPAPGMGLPAHVDARLREEFDLQVAPPSSEQHDASVDALYVTADEPHQLSLIPGAELKISVDDKLSKVDAVYVTRFQKERWAEAAGQTYPKVDRKFLADPRYSKTSVMHPLPRVGELDVDLDTDSRAAYFRQAAYGVPVRMALIALVLGLDGKVPLARFANGFRDVPLGLYRQPHGTGLACANPNCIVHDPQERPYTANKFHVLEKPVPMLRCFYCEHDVRDFVVGSSKTGAYGEAASLRGGVDDMIAFATAADAEAAGYHAAETPRRRRARA